jgi:streptogramin lyase
MGIEDVLTNNSATTTVTVWRADIITTKDGYSCGADNVCGNSDDSQTSASIGETLRYKIEYDNIGNTDAKNVILQELVPAGTCFKVGSITPISGASIEYSSDSASSWGYTPVGAAGVCDNSITNFRVKWDTLRAPANVISVDTLGEIDNPGVMDLNTTISTSTTLGPIGDYPLAITTDAAGNVYTVNSNSNNVTKITPDGTVTTLGPTGSSPSAITTDAAGNVYTANENSGNVTKITPSGTVSTLGATGGGPSAITTDAAGNVYTANRNSNNVTKITPDGTVSTLGPTGSFPRAITTDSAGNVYTANSASNNVTKITPGGTITTLGPTGNDPAGIAIDTFGNVYTANSDSNNVTKITPAGVSTILGPAGGRYSYSITTDSAGNVYVANPGSSNVVTKNVTRITPDGTVTTLGPTGNYPAGIAIDTFGNVYTANSYSNNVTKITQNQNPDIRLQCSTAYTVPAYSVTTPEVSYPQVCKAGGYATYQAISPTTNFAWDKFLVNQTVPASTTVNYTLCKTNFTAVANTCPASAIIHSGPVSGGFLDISAVPTTQNIYVRADLSGAGSDTPIVDSMNFTYKGPTPSFSWDAKVITTQSPISSINNVVSITTDTPEMSIANNSDTDIIQLNQADL